MIAKKLLHQNRNNSMENIIVIGGGLMGNSAAWQLSKHNERVLLLEQQGEKYTNGSSYGEARIARSLGPKEDIFSYLNNRTVKEVRKLLRFLNELDEAKPHKMKDIYRTSPVSYLFDKKLHQEQIKKLTYKNQKDKYKPASGKAAFKEFGVSIPASKLLIREYKKHSGTFNPRELIRKMRLGIEAKGSKIEYHQKVLEILKKEEGYEIKVCHTATNEIKIWRAKKVLVAVGPYIADLLKEQAPYLKKLIIPKRVLLSYFRIEEKRYFGLSEAEKEKILEGHPMFDQNGKMFFSMVEQIDEIGRPIFKVGGHLIRKKIIDLDKVWQIPPTEKEIKWAKKAFLKYLEMLKIPIHKKDIEYTGGYNCVYSMSNTEIPFVSNLLSEGKIDKNMVIIGGMSGVGAKGSLAYGQIAANLLIGMDENGKMYRKVKKALGSPKVRLKT
jgi:glycine/D-amino acid oxidase-like deaminating enzyme